MLQLLERPQVETNLHKGNEVLKRYDYNLFVIKHSVDTLTFHICNIIMHTPCMNLDPERINSLSEKEITEISEWLCNCAEEAYVR
jgi:hypothetical protein